MPLTLRQIRDELDAIQPLVSEVMRSATNASAPLVLCVRLAALREQIAAQVDEEQIELGPELRVGEPGGK